MEFLNRFTDVVLFRPLEFGELARVTDLILKKFAARMKQEKNLLVRFEEDVAEYILTTGYNPAFGARSLNRFVEEHMGDSIARKVIADDIGRGQEVVVGVRDIT
jgi:ATP-dependent Clp protease ATP-binding subunit ClpA